MTVDGRATMDTSSRGGIACSDAVPRVPKTESDRGAAFLPVPPTSMQEDDLPEPDRKYVRVYYSVVNDDRFADVYHDARHFGTWLQLLLVADAMYPADAPVPAYVARASFRVLVAAGLVEERPHQHYRLHGLASEREMRSQTGRNAAALRWQSESNADPMPRQDEHRQDKTNQAETSNAPDAAVSYNVRTGRYPSSGILKWLTDIARKAGAGDELAGEARVAAMIDRTPYTGTPKEYLELIDDTIRREDHDATSKELREESARNKAKREPLPEEPWRAEQRRIIEAGYAEEAK